MVSIEVFGRTWIRFSQVERIESRPPFSSDELPDDRICVWRRTTPRQDDDDDDDDNNDDLFYNDVRNVD